MNADTMPGPFQVHITLNATGSGLTRKLTPTPPAMPPPAASVTGASAHDSGVGTQTPVVAVPNLAPAPAQSHAAAGGGESTGSFQSPARTGSAPRMAREPDTPAGGASSGVGVVSRATLDWKAPMLPQPAFEAETLATLPGFVKASVTGSARSLMALMPRPQKRPDKCVPWGVG